MTIATPTLHLLCGKIASGKSTLAAKLADQSATVLISEDAWLSALFKEEMRSIEDYLRYAAKLRQIMGPHVASVLDAGVSVVLDFPANTVENRRWMRELLSDTNASHQLHFLDVPDELCLARLRARNATAAHEFAASEEQFRMISSHFAPPSPDEGFHILTHRNG